MDKNVLGFEGFTQHITSLYDYLGIYYVAFVSNLSQQLISMEDTFVPEEILPFSP